MGRFRIWTAAGSPGPTRVMRQHRAQHTRRTHVCTRAHTRSDECTSAGDGAVRSTGCTECSSAGCNTVPQLHTPLPPGDAACHVHERSPDYFLQMLQIHNGIKTKSFLKKGKVQGRGGTLSFGALALPWRRARPEVPRDSPGRGPGLALGRGFAALGVGGWEGKSRNRSHLPCPGLPPSPAHSICHLAAAARRNHLSAVISLLAGLAPRLED